MPVSQLEEKFLIESKSVCQFMEYLWKGLTGLIGSAVTRNIISTENAKAVWWHTGQNVRSTLKSASLWKTLLAGSGNSSQALCRRALQACLFLLLNLSKRLSAFSQASLYLLLLAVSFQNTSISFMVVASRGFRLGGGPLCQGLLTWEKGSFLFGSHRGGPCQRKG